MTDLLARTRASILVTDDQKTKLHAVAGDCGMSFAAWAREILLAAADASPLLGQMETAAEIRDRLHRESLERKAEKASTEKPPKKRRRKSRT